MSGEGREPEKGELERIAKAMRFALVAIVLCLGAPTLHLSFSIARFMNVFADLFRGLELPLVTTLVFHARPAFWFLSIAAPLGALGTLRMRDFAASFYILGAITVFTAAQFLLLYLALSAPLFRLIIAFNPRAAG